MPIGSFKFIPRTLVEWSRFFETTEVTPTSGSVGADQLQDGSVTFQKLQHVAPDRLLGRDTSPAGVIQELEVGGGLEFTGSGIQRSELTGDVTAGAGDGETQFRDFAALSVLGRSADEDGPPAEIVAGSNGQFLKRSADALGFAGIVDADIPATIPKKAGVETISGTWTFSAANPTIILSSSLPLCLWNETDAAANNRVWRAYAEGAQFFMDVANDALTTNVTFMQVNRTGNVVNEVRFDATLIHLNGAFRVDASTTTSAPSAGAAGALPATPAGYVTINIGGTNRQIAYY